MATVQKIYEEMQRMAPLELAESWDTPACWWTAAGRSPGCW